MSKFIELIKSVWARVRVALKPAAKAGVKAAAEVIEGAVKGSAALILFAVLTGCSTQVPHGRGSSVLVFNFGFPVVAWFTADQKDDNAGPDANAAVQQNPVTPTVDFPVVK